MNMHLELVHVQEDPGVLEVRGDEFERFQEYLKHGQAGIRVAALQHPKHRFCFIEQLGLALSVGLRPIGPATTLDWRRRLHLRDRNARPAALGRAGLVLLRGCFDHQLSLYYLYYMWFPYFWTKSREYSGTTPVFGTVSITRNLDIFQGPCGREFLGRKCNINHKENDKQ